MSVCVALPMGWAYPGNSVASYFMWRLLSQAPLFSVSSSSMPSNRKRPATSAPVRQSSRRRRPSSSLHLPGEPADPTPASTGDDSANMGDVPASRVAQNVNAASPTTIPPALLSHITAEVLRVVAASLGPFQHHPRLPQSRSNLFVSVYTSKFPSETPAVMTYGEVVRDLACRSGDWKYYDTNFRYMWQQNPSWMAWGATHWERRRPQHLGLTLPHLFPGGIAASSLQALLALAALISTSFPSVKLIIQPVSAFFVPQSSKALHAPLPTRLPDRPGLSPELPTPIWVDRFLPLLYHYAPEAALYLANGFTRGFPHHFDGPRTSSFASNFLSARQHPSVVTAKLSQELAARRIAGIFKTHPFSQFRISPLGVVPKKTPGS